MGKFEKKANKIRTLTGLFLALMLLSGCEDKEMTTDYGDTDFTKFKTPGSMEEAYTYQNFFLPAKDKLSQPYVGDTMPYYEDGTYYIYYLKDGGDSYNHSVYLATTQDFTTFTETDEPILEADRNGGQDSWIGTGSVVKVDGEYLFFYTGHSSSATEFKETIMLAKGTTPQSFEKCDTFEIVPDPSLKQKTDFRDPEAHIDAESGDIVLTVTASCDGLARILKYTVKRDLSSYTYDGIIYDDPIGNVYNLECSDTFQIGDVCYITYSAQDDTLWYARSENPYGPFTDPRPLDNQLFYAAKHVTDGNSDYMVGWIRRSDSPSDVYAVAAWGGNLAAQKIIQKPDGSLVLTAVDAVRDSYSVQRKLLAEKDTLTIEAGSLYDYREIMEAYEGFKLTGNFSFAELEGCFGLAFDYKQNPENYKMIAVYPKEGRITLEFGGGSTTITELPCELVPGREYSFTYIEEGSVGMFYIDETLAFSVRLYGISGKPVRVFAGDNKVTFRSLSGYTREKQLLGEDNLG